jgi:NAD(P)-dependent dehydrogenase (short-subunit alcohol dehydrogenase family)
MSSFLERRANLAGKVAALIGGGGGIGRACSLALAETGVDLVICDIDVPAMEDTAEAARAMGRTVTTLETDASDPAALDAFYDLAAKETDRLDIVVNVAGGTRFRNFMETDAAADARDIQRNFGYIIQSVRRAVPLIRRGGIGGSIINFTTIEGHRGAGGISVYSAAKAANTHFTRAMAVELGAERIRLNCLAPDTTWSQGNINAMTPEMWAAWEKVPESAQAKGIEVYIPQRTPAPQEALADGVVFLASDLSACVTGTSLHVDGGTWAAAGWLHWPFGDGFAPCPMGNTLAALYGTKE